MAIKLADEYVNVNPPGADYPNGSIKNSTTPTALDGTPVDEVWGNDREGMFQALLASSGITPSGVPDTAVASQYLQSLIELASGRAYNYDDTGAVDAYVLAAQSGQQAPASLFDGQLFFFKAGNSNTGASTVSLFGLGVKSITDVAGAPLTSSVIVAGRYVTLRYNLVSDRCEIIRGSNGVLTSEYISSAQTIVTAGQLILAHGLGVEPKLLRYILECQTAELGYSIGDRVAVDMNSSIASQSRFSSAKIDATNITIRYSDLVNVFTLGNATSGAVGAPTNANWRLFVRAFA